VNTVNVNETPAQQIARLTAENMKLKAAQPKARPLSFKVTAKGGISVYGLGRFPVTIYKEQWLRLIAASPELKSFIEANDALITVNSETHRATKQ
jgi:hypothetical protein